MKQLGNQSGLTLVELLVVAVLLAVMSTILFGTVTSLLRSKSLVEGEQDTGRMAQYAIGKITRELAARSQTGIAASDEDGQTLTGGSSRSRQIYFEGEDKTLGSAPADRIRFVSSNAAQGFIGATPNYGMIEVEYRLEEAKDSAATTERPEDGLESYVLIREELPSSVRDSSTRDERKLTFPIAENVIGLNFRFMKDEKWQNDWSEKAQLPEVLELTLRLRAPSGKIDTFRTAIAVKKRTRKARGLQ